MKKLIKDPELFRLTVLLVITMIVCSAAIWFMMKDMQEHRDRQAVEEARRVKIVAGSTAESTATKSSSAPKSGKSTPSQPLAPIGIGSHESYQHHNSPMSFGRR